MTDQIIDQTTDQYIQISGLPPSQPLTGSEVLPMDQGLSTVQATAQQIANLAPKTDLGYIPATRTLTSSTGEDIEIPEASATVSGLLPAAWISGASPALFPHIHGNIAGTVYEHVRNVSGATMAALTPYHVVNSQGDTDGVQIIPADASDPASMPASGILMTALANNEDGHGVIAGVPTGLNTAANPSGTVLYVGSGVLTLVPPAANVQALAIVGRSHATTGTLAMLSGPALARVAYSGDYNHLANKPTLGSAAAQDVSAFATAAQGSKADTAVQPGTLATVLGDYVLGTDFRLSNDREWSAATVEQAEAEAGTATTRRAWTAERVRQAIAAWWTGTRSAPGAIGGTTPSTGQFTGVGLGGALPTTGYAAALGSAVIPQGLIVTASGSTYTCNIRESNRFLLAAAVSGNITINCTNLEDLAVSSPKFKYVEFQLDFFYTAGIVTVQGTGFTTKWDGNAAAAPTVNEFEQLIVQITPAIAGTPFTTPTVKIAPMRGNT